MVWGFTFLCVWLESDGGIRMRHLAMGGPFETVVSVQKPAGCSRPRDVRVTHNTGIYCIALECDNTVYLEARSADPSLDYWWTRKLPSFAPRQRAPDIALWASGAGNPLGLTVFLPLIVRDQSN